MSETLLQETLEELKENGKTIEDIRWCGVRLITHNSASMAKYDETIVESWCNWNQFKRFINIEYDGSFGSQEVNPGLVIVGDDFWLERHEYDGSEWWEFKTMPSKPEVNRVPVVFKKYW